MALKSVSCFCVCSSLCVYRPWHRMTNLSLYANFLQLKLLLQFVFSAFRIHSLCMVLPRVFDSKSCKMYMLHMRTYKKSVYTLKIFWLWDKLSKWVAGRGVHCLTGSDNTEPKDTLRSREAGWRRWNWKSESHLALKCSHYSKLWCATCATICPTMEINHKLSKLHNMVSEYN